jgi:hypothetical protein
MRRHQVRNDARIGQGHAVGAMRAKMIADNPTKLAFEEAMDGVGERLSTRHAVHQLVAHPVAGLPLEEVTNSQAQRKIRKSNHEPAISHRSNV